MKSQAEYWLDLSGHGRAGFSDLRHLGFRLALCENMAFCVRTKKLAVDQRGPYGKGKRCFHLDRWFPQEWCGRNTEWNDSTGHARGGSEDLHQLGGTL